MRPLKILLVEDSPDDVVLLWEAFAESNVSHNIFVVSDGVEALNFLNMKESYENAPRPDLILLDLNLPKKSGKEVLQEIKSKNSLKEIPVIVLTTSDNNDDIHSVYKLHANSYIKKPIDLETFVDMVKKIEEYWSHIVSLPH